MAYYSKEVGIIYHQCLGCFAGNNIEKVNMTEGKPRGARLCKICANLESMGKCTVGTPIGVTERPSGRERKARQKRVTYYSKLQKAIFHECSNCSVGNNMVLGNLEIGKPKPVKKRGGKIRRPRLCRTCRALKRAGKAIFGIPELPREEKGAKVETYYSKKCPQIFHICQNCFLGQNIEKENLVKDQPPVVKDGKEPRLCRVCTRVCISGECKIGTPIPAGTAGPESSKKKELVKAGK